MATIIDALVVELGFDTSGMEKGRVRVEDAFKRTQDSAKKTGKTIDEAAKNSGEYLNKLRNNVLALFAAFTAGRGIKEFVTDITQTDAGLGRFANMVGQSAEKIASWRGAGRLMGVQAGEIDSAISSLTQNFQQFALTGESSMVPWLRALGLNLADATGKMKPFDQILLEVSKRIQGMDHAKATAILTNLGFGPGMIQVLLQGPAAIQKLIDKQKDLAKAQAADADAAARRQLAWEAFLSQAERVGIILLTTLTPALEAVANGLEAVAKLAGDNPNAAGAVFSALTAVVVALSAALAINLAGTALAAVAAGFTGMTGVVAAIALRLAVLTSTVLPALSEAFFALAVAIEATPIGWIITGVAALGAIGFILYKNWNSIAAWWKKLWTGMGDDAQEGADKVTGASDQIKGAQESRSWFSLHPSAPAASNSNPGGQSGPDTGKALWYGHKGGPTQEADIAALERFGWTKEQATGIVANIQGESWGNFKASGDKGTAYGLGQWHADRQARFKAWAGHDIQQSTRAEQLGFIDYELRHQERAAGDSLSQVREEGAAARVVTNLYERPGDKSGQSEARAAIAHALAAKAPANAVPSPRALAAASQQGNRYQSNSTSNDVRIGQMTIHSKAEDAAALAKDIHPALENEFAQQANFGPV